MNCPNEWATIGPFQAESAPNSSHHTTLQAVIGNLSQSSCEKNSVYGVPLINDSSGPLSRPSPTHSPVSPQSHPCRIQIHWIAPGLVHLPWFWQPMFLDFIVVMVWLISVPPAPSCLVYVCLTAITLLWYKAREMNQQLIIITMQAGKIPKWISYVGATGFIGGWPDVTSHINGLRIFPTLERS